MMDCPGRVDVSKTLTWKVAMADMEAVWFPPVVMKMDPRIQLEFIGELMNKFKMILVVPGSVLKNGALSIREMPPPVFLESLHVLNIRAGICSSAHHSALLPYRLRNDTCRDIRFSQDESHIKSAFQKIAAALTKCPRLEQIEVGVTICRPALLEYFEDERHVSDFAQGLREEIASAFCKGPPTVPLARKATVILYTADQMIRLRTTYYWSPMLQSFVTEQFEGDYTVNRREKRWKMYPHDSITCQELGCVSAREALKRKKQNRTFNALKRKMPIQGPIPPDGIQEWIDRNLWGDFHSRSVDEYEIEEDFFMTNPFDIPSRNERRAGQAFAKDFIKRAARRRELHRQAKVSTDAESQSAARVAIKASLQPDVDHPNGSADRTSPKLLKTISKFLLLITGVPQAIYILAEHASASVFELLASLCFAIAHRETLLQVFINLIAFGLEVLGFILPHGKKLLRDVFSFVIFGSTLLLACGFLFLFHKACVAVIVWAALEVRALNGGRG
ncbi:uncharacterized protein LTHEOB_11902 [Neofusicoccum parvum]|nr:uncharacterized protein LTHEOB_11902 [Neofusicoccum parvum]